MRVCSVLQGRLLTDGEHSIERCAEVTEAVLHEVFNALLGQRVVLELIVLKPSMVVPGKVHARQAAHTLRVPRRCVPAAVASINFLSGGQTPPQATATLDAMNRFGAQPWPLSFPTAARCSIRR